jgi:hypothetical protein
MAGKMGLPGCGKADGKTGELSGKYRYPAQGLMASPRYLGMVVDMIADKNL